MNVDEQILYWANMLDEAFDEGLKLKELTKDDACRLLDAVERGKLNTATGADWQPECIRKTSPDYLFFASYLGEELSPETVAAVISLAPDRPKPGFMYFDELTGVRRGYGMKTMAALLEKYKDWKIWFMASSSYDERTDTYFPNEKLNGKYRKFPGVVEYKKFADLWNCDVSWFYTKNCGNEIVKMVDSGNYMGV